MPYNPDKHHRRSIRLKGYDYASVGAYFITICTQNRACLFGTISDGTMQPNAAGQMVQQVWQKLPQRFSNIDLGEFVVMPNHIHGIIVLRDPANSEPQNTVGAPLVGAPDNGVGGESQHTVGVIVGAPDNGNGESQNTVGAPLVGAPDNGVGTRPTPTGTGTGTGTGNGMVVGDVVGAFKSITTHQYTLGVHQNGWEPFCKRLWQRNYYEHIIRDETALLRIGKYIQRNPLTWWQDQLHPNSPSK